MKKITKSLIAISAVLIAFSCTKDMAETPVATPVEGKQLAFTATVDDSRVERANDGKLSWCADDAFGIFVGTDINAKATTSAELVADGTFIADGITSESGTIYAYYPYNSFSSQSTGTSDVWLSIAQGQMQSAKDVFDAGKYFTMVSDAAEWDGTTKPSLKFSAAGSALRFNIYDNSGKYASEKIKSIEVVSDNALVGGYKYNLATREYDMTSSINRKAAIVNVAEPFAVGDNANAYMAVLPGNHTPKIVVRTDGGAHVFEFTSALVCTAGKVGTVKLNLGNAAVKHYVLYNTFDLMIWGGDYMHDGDVGYSPIGEAKPATADYLGEEPYIFANKAGDKGADGTADFKGMSQEFMLSRGIDGYTFSKAYERPGHIKLGTSSAGYTLGTPKFTGLTTDTSGETIKVTFTANRWSSANDEITLSVIGDGLINATDESVVVELPKYTGGVANAPANIATMSYTIYGATANTSLVLKGTGKCRTNLDDLFVERIESATTPLLVVTDITVDAESDNATISWETIADAESYDYKVTDEAGNLKVEGNTHQASVIIPALEASTKYFIEIQAIADKEDKSHTDGAWSDKFEFYTTSAISDTHESGYVFFADDLSWMNTDEFKGEWYATASENCFRIDNLATTLGEAELAIWNAHGYTAANTTDKYLYVHPYSYEKSYFRFGRAYNEGACVATVNMPASALKDITTGASVDVVFSVDLAKTTTFDKANTDYGVAIIKAITGDNIDEQRITLDASAEFKTYSVEFKNVNATTQFVIGNTNEGDKADRFVATNFKIAKQ